jgi:hypothetical protein
MIDAVDASYRLACFHPEVKRQAVTKSKSAIKKPPAMQH